MLPSGLPEIIAGDEPIAVFLTSSSHYNTTIVKAAAFLPNSKNGEKSVCRHGAVPPEELQRLSQLFFANSSHVHIHGAGIFSAQVVTINGLTIESEEPPDRHANIRRWVWSQDDPKMGKAANLEKAKLLAEKTTLVTW